MVRTQIQLEEAQHRNLKLEAAHRGVSVAQLVREGVDQILAEATRDRQWDAMWEVLGTLSDRDSATDVAENHDAYLDEIYGRS